MTSQFSSRHPSIGRVYVGRYIIFVCDTVQGSCSPFPHRYTGTNRTLCHLYRHTFIIEYPRFGLTFASLNSLKINGYTDTLCKKWQRKGARAWYWALRMCSQFVNRTGGARWEVVKRISSRDSAKMIMSIFPLCYK